MGSRQLQLREKDDEPPGGDPVVIEAVARSVEEPYTLEPAGGARLDLGRTG